MDVIVDRCAGLDIGKQQVQVCVRGPDGAGGRRSEVRTFDTFTESLEALARWLAGEGVTEVAMEATGPYWKPVWYVLEDAGFDQKLVNSRHVKILPGRKTDVGDAAWLAELLEHGLLRGSFVPPEQVRRLRDVTRYRKKLIQAHTSECQRIHKNLEDAGIKLDSVASDVLGVSGRAMLRALLAGERDPVVLADLAKGTLRRKIPELERALRGRFAAHHAILIGIVLDHIEHLEAAIAALDTQVDTIMSEPDPDGTVDSDGTVVAPFARARDRLDTIPGVGKRAAEVIVAEIGIDMTRFPTAGHLASWAGMCPGNNVTGGKNRSGRTTKGDVWLRDILVQCAWTASRTRDTYLAAQFWRLSRRIGKKKAAMAVGHSILIAAWHILAHDVDYDDLGGDWFARKVNDDHRRDQAIRNLHDLGYRVTLDRVA
jgi:transposase